MNFTQMEDYNNDPKVLEKFGRNIVDEVNPKFISEGSISVYVKEASSGKYYEYQE